jgi:hypothetical protein
LSKDNEPKTEKAKGGKGKGSVLQKNAHAREKAMTAIERAEHNRKRFSSMPPKKSAIFNLPPEVLVVLVTGVGRFFGLPPHTPKLIPKEGS